MSKWIYGAEAKTWWNLDHVMKVKKVILPGMNKLAIQLIYPGEEGEQWLEYETEEKLNEAWEKLSRVLMH